MSSLLLLQDYDGSKAGAVVSVPFGRGRELVTRGVARYWDGGRALAQPEPAPALVVVPEPDPAPVILAPPVVKVSEPEPEAKAAPDVTNPPFSQRRTRK